ncbi:UNVERIFIED_CONTAM: hypothetical protein FKN15_025594 [Acipenser sinensis]
MCSVGNGQKDETNATMNSHIPAWKSGDKNSGKPFCEEQLPSDREGGQGL